MTGEYRVDGLFAEVLVAPTPLMRLEGVFAEVIVAPPPDFRMDGLFAEVLGSLLTGFGPIGLANLTYDTEAYPIQGLLPTLPLVFVGADASAVYPPSTAILPFTLKTVERNPYQTTAPAAESTTADEQQRILRDQHNRTQAGDTTFDYGVLLKGDAVKQYTLGSMGRFYHPNFGLIVARYVQFSKMVESQTQGRPVGRLKKAEGVDWVVTNDITKSGPDLVSGICCIADQPAEGTFGWVVTQGANPVALEPAALAIPADGTQYTWAATGIVGIGLTGRVLGRRWGQASTSQLAPGFIFVEIEGLSPAELSAFIRSELSAELLAVSAGSAAATELKGRVDGHDSAIAAIQLVDSDLAAQIALEERTRVRDVRSIRDALGRLGGDPTSLINAAVGALGTRLDAADTRIQNLATTAQARADAAYALAAGVGVGGINLRLTSLEVTVGGLSGVNYFDIDPTTLVANQVLVATDEGGGVIKFKNVTPSASGGVYAPLVNGDTARPLILFNSDGAVMLVRVS